MPAVTAATLLPYAFAILGFAVGWYFRPLVLTLLIGVPFMVLGYLYGYVQSGLITGYGLYLKYDDKTPAPTDNKTLS